MALFGVAWSCVVAALLSVVGDVLQFAAFSMHYKKSHMINGNRESFLDLDPDVIAEEWEIRRDMRPLETAAGLLNAVSWVVLCIPLLKVAWRMSHEQTNLMGLHVSIAVLALSATNMEFLSHVMFIGAMTAMEWLSTDFNLDQWLYDSSNRNPDDIGWRSLEVTYIALRGTHLWVDAIEHLFLAFILILIFFAIQRQDSKTILSMPFGTYSLVLSFICFVDFCFEVLRFVSWRTFARAAFGISILGRLILWPIWLIWLGRQLNRRPLARVPTVEMSYGGQQAAGSQSMETNPFVTDEVDDEDKTGFVVDVDNSAKKKALESEKVLL